MILAAPDWWVLAGNPESILSPVAPKLWRTFTLLCCDDSELQISAHLHHPENMQKDDRPRRARGGGTLWLLQIVRLGHVRTDLQFD